MPSVRLTQVVLPSGRRSPEQRYFGSHNLQTPDFHRLCWCCRVGRLVPPMMCVRQRCKTCSHADMLAAKASGMLPSTSAAEIHPVDGLNIELLLQAQAFGRIMTVVVQSLGVGQSPAGLRRDQIMDDASAQRLNDRVRVSGTWKRSFGRQCTLPMR